MTVSACEEEQLEQPTSSLIVCRTRVSEEVKKSPSGKALRDVKLAASGASLRGTPEVSAG